MAREHLSILGRNIGTHDGWDQIDTEIFIFYKFEPFENVKTILPPGDLSVNYDGGYFEYHDAEGNPTEMVDLIDTLKAITRG